MKNIIIVHEIKEQSGIDVFAMGLSLGTPSQKQPWCSFILNETTGSVEYENDIFL